MEIIYHKLVFGKLRVDSYKIVDEFTNYSYRQSHAIIARCYYYMATAFVILLYFSDFLSGMCSADLKQLLLLVQILAILTKLCISFSVFLYYNLLPDVKF